MTTDTEEPEGSETTAEIRINPPGGVHALKACAVALGAGAVLVVWAIRLQVGSGGSSGLRAGFWVGGIALAVVGGQCLRGLTTVAPGDAVVLALFGRYVGTIRAPGLHWVRPWTRRRHISVRIRSQATGVARVNDAEGNPIEISVVVVWRVGDTALASFEVEDIDSFVHVQCDAAVRHVASRYPYDSPAAGEPSLCRGGVTDQLTAEIADRVAPGGAKVIESRIVHLAYAPEIAQAMLRRQQAGAIVAARTQIVEGAVGMVELALNRLDEENVVDLDEERKAAMVSNLLVVLCSDHPTQPIVNAGSLYH